MSSCPAREEILELAHGEKRAAVETHLKACRACAATYEEIVAATGAISAYQPQPEGRCLSESDLVDYLHTQNIAVEAHLASCPKCQDELIAMNDALESYASGAFPSVLANRIKNLVPRKSSSSATLRAVKKPTAKFATVRRPRPSASPVPYAVAAAALLGFALLLIAMNRRGPEPVVPKIAKETTPEPEPKPEPPKPEIVKPLPKPEPKPEPEKTPEPFVKPEPKPVPKPEPEKPPDPVVKPEPKTEPKVDPPTKAEDRLVATVLTAVRGAGQLADRALAAGEVQREERIATGRLQAAAFDVGEEYAVFLREDSAVRLEKRETGAVRIAVEKGEAYFTVAKRAQPFVVATAHGEVEVRGTAFSVVAEAKRTVLTVSEGLVHFKNAKGGVDVKAGAAYSADANSKPRQLAPVDVKALLAWTRRPDLTGEALPPPWMEQYATTKKMPGVVVSSPYFDWENDSGRLAKAVAGELESGLFLGHQHRDKKDRKIWVNIDRGTEGIVANDGSLGQAQVTERAKKYYEEYLVHLREATGLGPKAPANFIVTLREHSESIDVGKGPEELNVCEVAWFGFNRTQIKQAKALLEQLVAKQKPKTTFPVKWDELDDKYDYKGKAVNFRFTEGDAKTSGWMTTPVCRKGIAMFFPPCLGQGDVVEWAPIVAELVEAMYAMR